jgi:hypothetical protein
MLKKLSNLTLKKKQEKKYYIPTVIAFKTTLNLQIFYYLMNNRQKKVTIKLISFLTLYWIFILKLKKKTLWLFVLRVP